ncbi:hypothetical protein [Vibrio phage ICP2]|uniref:Uncharacterized protein 40 n=1 Tax=Vibrio phage ICP2 TaxID=979533 RepID=F1D0P9_9CAUD|nr:hypothetical protein ViPhICP2p40 [Vibrio phage ICP2]ADX87722.1 hypothetical protein [Vibrio phage ICP2]
MSTLHRTLTLENKTDVPNGQRVTVVTHNNKDYDVEVLAHESDRFGSYAICRHIEDESQLCLVFNHSSSSTCAYVGFSERELFSLLEKYLTNTGK